MYHVAKRIAVCVTGASGVIYGYRLLKALSKEKGVETYAVITEPAALIIKHEMMLSAADFEKLADHSYSEDEWMAPVASGSFRIDGTVIAPCSMRTLSSIANGYDDTLASRMGSIALKERRKLILLVRETPLSSIYLRNMLAVSDAGGIIMPPLPQIYFGETDLEKMADLTVGRVLSMLGIETKLHREWNPRS